MVIRIKAKVKHVSMYLDHPESSIHNPNYAEDQIADMLRYDSGIIMSKQRIGDEVHFTIRCQRYTERRWRSFGIETEVM